MKKIKRINLAEFRNRGYLQEVNRQFLHRLGLALEVSIEEDGTVKLGGIWDYRTDPEGIIFSDGNLPDLEHVERVGKELAEKDVTREKQFGWTVQPPGEEGKTESGPATIGEDPPP